jgi:transposase InsO family protein
MAWFKRHPSKQAGLIFHSDRGSQCASHDFRDVLTEYGFTASMSRRGNCWDNACSETLRDFCVEALREAAARWRAPEIANTDKGSQFSGVNFVAEVKRLGALQSMDGRGCWRDNVFVERLWRSVKYEDVYLKAYDGVNAARQSLAAYFEFYNAHRPHQSHDGCTPDMVYFDSLPPTKAAA